MRGPRGPRPRDILTNFHTPRVLRPGGLSARGVSLDQWRLREAVCVITDHLSLEPPRRVSHLLSKQPTCLKLACYVQREQYN